MANSVTIRTSAPGAKQAATDIGMLKANIMAMGSKTGGPLGGMTSGLGGLALGAAGAGLAIGALSGAAEGVGRWLGEGAKMAMEEEVALGRLDTALQNNVKNWDGNRDAIDRAIEKGMDLAYTDDELRDSMGKLVVATKDQEDAIRLQSLAMDVARGRNIDLAAATDIVVKANMGNVGALRRVGINIDKNATSAEILAQLTATYTGQAAKYGETLEGTFKAGDIALEEMQEKLGGKMLPLLEGMAETATNDVLPAMEDMVDVITGDADMSNSWIQKSLELFKLMPGDIGKAAQAAIDQFKVDAMGQRLMDQIQRVRDQTTTAMGSAGTHTAQAFGTKFNDTIKTIRFGKDLAPNLADELRDGVKNDIKDAMEDVKYAINHPMQQVRQAAQIEGALTTLNLKRGLASNTPAVNAVIDQQIQTLQGKWSQLTGVAYTKGANAANALENGLRTFNPPNLPVFGGITTGQGKNRKRKKREAGENAGGGGRAGGGPVQAGQTYLVGEEGPELLHMGGPGFVDNGKGGGRNRGRGGAIHVNVHLSTREFRGQTTHDRVLQGGGPAFR